MDNDPTDNPKVQAGCLFAVIYTVMCFFMPSLLGVGLGVLYVFVQYLVIKHFLDQWNR